MSAAFSYFSCTKMFAHWIVVQILQKFTALVIIVVIYLQRLMNLKSCTFKAYIHIKNNVDYDSDLAEKYSSLLSVLQKLRSDQFVYNACLLSNVFTFMFYYLIVML